MPNDSHARGDEKMRRHAMNYGFGPFSLRRWMYVPQVPDRKTLRFLPAACLNLQYEDVVRVKAYEFYVSACQYSAVSPADLYAMFDMYDGITLVREENDK